MEDWKSKLCLIRIQDLIVNEEIRVEFLGMDLLMKINLSLYCMQFDL